MAEISEIEIDGWRCHTFDDGQRIANTSDCVLSTTPNGGVLVQARNTSLAPASVLRWLLGDTPTRIETMVVKGGVGIDLSGKGDG